MEDKRHLRRFKIVQNLYSYTFSDQKKTDFPNTEEDVLATTNEILKKLSMIDSFIQKYAKRFPIEKIAKVDLSILRLAIYELLFRKEIPPKVVMDEAIILAKELGAERSYAFVNAVLEKVYREIKDEKN